ncbi:MAG: cytochrome c [Rhizobiales bacterium]|nr:cytochrome c [Hyphomicrobiales bacterium]
MKKSFIIATTAFAIVASSVATPVFADATENAIKARQSYYTLVGFNFGQLVAMAKGEAPYDAEAAKKAATNLQSLSTLDLLPLFPAGSDNVAQKGKTRATPKIWEDFAGVGKIVGDWQGAVSTLVSVAGDGQAALAPAVGAVGKQCGTCHETYRAKDF